MGCVDKSVDFVELVGKTEFESCPMSGSCGIWEYDHIKHDSGPYLHPFDGTRKKRRRNIPKPRMLTPRKDSDPREVYDVDSI